ncbi:MAG: sulfide/dihydroorotate dehydrogenase-like FAD/NAD-binding protein [Planctomycetes bacterium]|nr:sulfide/dihydroorotate dehydrogenase-like FAD/NAD-binding protein [Planctomycetota bacterium]
MYDITEKHELSPNVFLMKVKAPRIARKRKAGQFAILRVRDEGERFPLTLVDSDPDEGTLTLVFQAVGKSTMMLGKLNVGDCLTDLVGPLGKPTHIEKFGHVVCIGGGVGIACVYPIAKAMKEAGNRVTSIISARSKEILTLREEMEATSDELKIATDDGSLGFKGFPTDVLQQMIDAGEKIDLVVTVGPTIMMKFIAGVTRPHNIPTVASLNPIMVDGTGMCGGCRITVGDKTKFVCVDGPEFDAHLVDFDELMSRQKTYVDAEKQAVESLNPKS